MATRTEEFIPKWIAWETTQRCNLNCVHCRCSSDMQAAEGDFTTEEAFKLIDDICEVSKPVMVLSGGEPLMRKDIFVITSYSIHYTKLYEETILMSASFIFRHTSSVISVPLVAIHMRKPLLVP